MTLEDFASLFEDKYPKHNFNWKQYPTRWMGLCPFHEDTNPSFNIYQVGDGLFYKCFACGASGTLWDLKGEKRESKGASLQGGARKFIMEAQEELERNYNTTLLESKVLPEGGLIKDAIKFYNIGLVTEDLINNNQEFAALLEEKVRISQKIGWLVFPYYNLSGHIIFLKFRNINESSRSSRVFKLTEKRMPAYFGGLGFLQEFIKRPDGWVYPVIITEGETDAISVYLDSYIPSLAVGSASNYHFLLEDRFSQFNFFPIVFPDFDPFSMTSIGAGREAIVRLNEERKKKKVNEKIYILVDSTAYGSAKDINDAIVKNKIPVRKILETATIEELSSAARTFEREWKEWKTIHYQKTAEKLKDEIPQLSAIYTDFLNIKQEDVIEMSIKELLAHQSSYQPPILNRFPSYKISLIASFGGAGKTTFALMTACRIAEHEGLRVLFWTTEHTMESLQKKINQLAFLQEFWNIEEQEISFRFGTPETFIQRKTKLNSRAFEVIESLLDRYDVIFLDPLLSFMSGDENDNPMVRAVFDRLHYIMSKEKYAGQRKSLVFLHHFNKLAIKEAVIKQHDISQKDNAIEIKQEAIQNLMGAVRGASAVLDAARYVEAIIKTDTGRYCVTIKTNEDTRQAGKGEIVPEIRLHKEEEKKEEKEIKEIPEEYDENETEIFDF